MACIDIEVVGGGPAGVAVAIRLTQFGFRVRLFDTKSKGRQHVAESLPSSIRVVFAALALELPEDVVVDRPPAHRVYWGPMQGESVLDTPEGDSSLLVWRGPFDEYLHRAAVAAGVRWTEGRRPAGRTSDFVIDASGRAGFLSRAVREPESAFQTLALTGHFESDEPAPASATVIEAFADGFVWSAPLANGLRDVTVFVDAGRKLSEYEDLVGAAAHVSTLVTRASRVGAVRAADATPYWSRRCSDSEHLLVGDAASFLDPLSAHGVHKAMDGALVGAAVVRTILERPSAIADARAFYEDRERNIYRVTSEKMGGLYAQETRFAAHPFWRKRARPSPSASVPTPPLRPLSRTMRLRPAPGVRLKTAPVLENDYIERRLVLEAPGAERPARYLGGACLPDVFEHVVASDDVGTAARGAGALDAIDWLYRSGYLIVEA